MGERGLTYLKRATATQKGVKNNGWVFRALGGKKGSKFNGLSDSKEKSNASDPKVKTEPDRGKKGIST